MIEAGSKWSDGRGNKFVALKEIVIEDKTWVHYRDNFNTPPKEYSCYKESFLSRFTPLPTDR
jgi:hypothetical protein